MSGDTGLKKSPRAGGPGTPRSAQGCSFFAYMWKLRATAGLFCLQLCLGAFLLTVLVACFAAALRWRFRIVKLKSFAAIPSLSSVLLGHTNRSVRSSHESQHEIALVLALSRPIPYYQQGQAGEENGPVFRRVCVFDVSRGVGIARFETVSESQPYRTIQCH